MAEQRYISAECKILVDTGIGDFLDHFIKGIYRTFAACYTLPTAIRRIKNKEIL